MSRLRLRALLDTVRIDAPDSVLTLLRRSMPELVVDGVDAVADGDEPEIHWQQAGNGRWSVRLGAGGSLGDASTSLALAETISEINRLAARSVNDTHAILHAGSFGVDRRVVAVTGASGAGKSTLVAAAVLKGFGYVGDEVCAVDAASRAVLAFPRPIGLRAGGAAVLGIETPDHPLDPYREILPWQPPRTLPASPAGSLALIAVVERHDGPVELMPVTAPEALVRLTRLSLATERIERDVFRRLDQLVRTVPMVTIAYQDPFAAADALGDYAESSGLP